MKGFNFAFLLLSILFTNKGYAQREYLDEVFRIVEQHSINKNSVDFERIKKEAYAKLGNAQSIEDCYPVVTYILSELNDHHSFFMKKEKVIEWKSTSKRSNDLHSLPFSGKILINEIGYITMQGFSSGDPVSTSEYATTLQALIKFIDNKNLKGWIVDLRQNAGGNCWPMLAGLGPLLGEGICGHFIDNNREKTNWYYKGGKAGVNSIPMASIKNAPYKLLNEKNPIAVLTGPSTASSGEVVVTSFRGKTNVKLIGESTAGLTTGNSDFILSDGSIIFLTTSIYADRDGKSYGGKIIPDIVEDFDYEKINSENDPVIKRALDWIHGNK